MESKMQIFDSAQFGRIRTFDVKGNPWFVGRDVAVALGYKETAKAVREKVDIEDKGVSEIDTPGGKQQITIINESGLYSLIMSSKLPSAKQFKRWITSEVLPSIRITGGYVKPESVQLSDPISPRPKFLSQSVAEMMAEAKICDSRVSLANQWLTLFQIATDPEIKETCMLKAASVLNGGVDITSKPSNPTTLSSGENTASAMSVSQGDHELLNARQVSELIGIAPQRIGRLANLNNLKTDEYGAWLEYDGPFGKNVDSYTTAKVLSAYTKLLTDSTPKQRGTTYSMESITIDFDRIPDKEKRVLGDTLFTACKAFYENPDNLARYNAWKAKREAAHV